MVDVELLEQVRLLDRAQLLELRAVIDIELDVDIPEETWEILRERVADDDAHPDDVITLREFVRQLGASSSV